MKQEPAEVPREWHRRNPHPSGWGGCQWEQIVAVYDALTQVAPSPVVALNRAVAVGMAYGVGAGLEAVDALRPEPTLAQYHLLPAVRGDLLVKVGRTAEAIEEFERAASLTQNGRERDLLQQRATDARR